MTDVQPEEIRNKLLRRAEWRFLLPNPQPAKTICFADGLLAESAQTISQRVVTRSQASDCDLAIATNPGRNTLRQAWDALRPGGSCYIEW